MSGVFSHGGDQVVEVPIEDGVSRERELSRPNTASGVGRIAYGEGVAMSRMLAGAGVNDSGSRWLLGVVGAVLTLRGLTPTPEFVVTHSLGGRAGGAVHTLYIFIQKNPNVCDLRVSTNICSDITWISVPLLLTYTDTAKQT